MEVLCYYILMSTSRLDTFPINEEQLRSPEYRVNPATPEYRSLVEAVDRKIIPHRNMTYIPLVHEQQLEAPQNIQYGDRESLPAILAGVDAVICISRDEDLDPNYTDQYPDRNITLTPSGQANVATSVDLFHLAKAENPDVKFISTGRMHNGAIPMMFALPTVAEFAGINGEDANHIPEAQFAARIRIAFTPEEYATRLHAMFEAPDSSEALEYQRIKEEFLGSIQSVVGKDIRVPDENATQEELAAAAEALIGAYKKYPRISVSRLMLERAAQEGVPMEAIFEEDGAVDTITNLLHVADMLEHDEGLHNTKKIAVVAGSDHLPRTMWITNHILPDGIEAVFVESDAALNKETYAASCIREEQSFAKGSNWIDGTRKRSEIEHKAHEGYFLRFSPERIAAEVAAVALKNSGK